MKTNKTIALVALVALIALFFIFDLGRYFSLDRKSTRLNSSHRP